MSAIKNHSSLYSFRGLSLHLIGNENLGENTPFIWHMYKSQTKAQISKLCYKMGCHIKFCLINITEAFPYGNKNMSPKVARDTNHANLNLPFLANFYCLG